MLPEWIITVWISKVMHVVVVVYSMMITSMIQSTITVFQHRSKADSQPYCRLLFRLGPRSAGVIGDTEREKRSVRREGLFIFQCSLVCLDFLEEIFVKYKARWAIIFRSAQQESIDIAHLFGEEVAYPGHNASERPCSPDYCRGGFNSRNISVEFCHGFSCTVVCIFNQHPTR